MDSKQADAEAIKRQLDEINFRLEQERKDTGTIIKEQESELERAKKELEERRDGERKLKARIKELEGELEQTIKRIDQLQRGVTTPVRRKPLSNNSRGPSPYSRNSSGNKRATPPPQRPGIPSYMKPTRTSPSGNNRSNGSTGPRRYSPTGPAVG